MSRQILYQISLSVSLNESELALLRLIARRSAGGAPVSVTVSALSRDLKMSTATVRRSCRALAGDGLMAVRDVRRPDGGCAANSYALTLFGREVLAAKGSMRPRRVAPKKSGRGRADAPDDAGASADVDTPDEADGADGADGASAPGAPDDADTTEGASAPGGPDEPDGADFERV